MLEFNYYNRYGLKSIKLTRGGCLEDSGLEGSPVFLDDVRIRVASWRVLVCQHKDIINNCFSKTDFKYRKYVHSHA